jgi:hypothetical protein
MKKSEKKPNKIGSKQKSIKTNDISPKRIKSSDKRKDSGKP